MHRRNKVRHRCHREDLCHKEIFRKAGKASIRRRAKDFVRSLFRKEDLFLRGKGSGAGSSWRRICRRALMFRDREVCRREEAQQNLSAVVLRVIFSVRR